jgi:hypothetical protein
MTLLRSPQQGKLAELHSVGGGMTTRYSELIEGVAEPLRSVLAETVSQRAPLLERTREAERKRGDLPPAPDHEINQVRSLTDRILGGLFGEEALTSRLVRGEEAWLELVEVAREGDWTEDECELLDQLSKQAHSAVRRLRALT